MKFKIDENLPVEIAVMLRESGHDAMTVLEQRLGGHTDPIIAAVCKTEERVLLTLDLDFSNVQAYPPANHSGLVVFRLRQQDKPHVLAAFLRIMPLFEVEPMQGRLWIVDEQRVRIRS